MSGRLSAKEEKQALLNRLRERGDAAAPTVTQFAYEIASGVRHAREQLLSAKDEKQRADRLATVLLCSTASTFLAIAVATGDPQILNLCRQLVRS